MKTNIGLVIGTAIAALGIAIAAVPEAKAGGIRTTTGGAELSLVRTAPVYVAITVAANVSVTESSSAPRRSGCVSC